MVVVSLDDADDGTDRFNDILFNLKVEHEREVGLLRRQLAGLTTCLPNFRATEQNGVFSQNFRASQPWSPGWPLAAEPSSLNSGNVRSSSSSRIGGSREDLRPSFGMSSTAEPSPPPAQNCVTTQSSSSSRVAGSREEAARLPAAAVKAAVEPTTVDAERLSRSEGGVSPPRVSALDYNSSRGVDQYSSRGSSASPRFASNDKGVSQERISKKKGESVLHVKIERCRDLRNADNALLGVSDPYCTCMIQGKPNTLIKTPVVQNSLNPVWNYEADFYYASGDALVFNVWDKDNLKSDDPLGTVTLEAAQFYPNGFHEELKLEGPGSEGADGHMMVSISPVIQDLDAVRAVRSAARSNTWGRTSRTKELDKGFLVELPGARKHGPHMTKTYSNLTTGFDEKDINKGFFEEAHEAWVPEHAQEGVVAIFILLNAMYVGWSLEHHSVQGEPLDHDIVFQYAFFAAFSLDIIIRIIRTGRSFLTGEDRKWNIFDTFVVSTMLLELIGFEGAQLSVMRMLRLLRILRILRTFKTLHALIRKKAFREVRIFVEVAREFVRVFVSVLLVSLLLVYMMGCLVADAALETCSGGRSNDTLLCTHFGTMSSSAVSLLKGLYGGMLWGVLLDALEDLNILYSILVTILMLFGIIVMLNFATATIIDMVTKVTAEEIVTALSDTKSSKQRHVHDLIKLFRDFDVNDSGSISSQEFMLALKNQDVIDLLEVLKIHAEDMRFLFEMLDIDGTGALELEEFLDGLMRCRGEATALDVIKVQLDLAKMLDEFQSFRDSLQPTPPENLDDTVEANQPQQCICGNIFMSDSKFCRKCGRSRLARNSEHFKRLRTSMKASGALLPAMLEPSQRGKKRVKRVEDRAVSLEELRMIRRYVAEHCQPERWVDMRTGKALIPEDVNLYHLNYYHISPVTLPNGVILRGFTHSESGSTFQPGQEVMQKYPLGESAAVHRAEGIIMEVYDEETVKLRVVRGSFLSSAAGEAGQITIDWQDYGPPAELELAGSFSYKEILSPAPRPSRWFCSHWWGEGIFDFVECCEEHSRLRRLEAHKDANPNYWVCAYANSQHDLEQDIRANPNESSFAKAMRVSVGVLLILDEHATPFRRIWCDYELYRTAQYLSDESKGFDIVTKLSSPKGAPGPHLLSDGILPGEPATRKLQREKHFPLKLLVQGLTMKLEDGEASIAQDKEHIFGAISKDAGGDLDLGFQRANCAIHSYLARAAWSQAIKSGSVLDFDPSNPGTLELPAILAADLMRHKLVLSFPNDMEVTNEQVKVLAMGLPPHLRELKLSFEGCDHVGDGGVFELVDRLPLSLESLYLDFVGCAMVTDKGIEAIATKLSALEGLSELRLDFDMCPHITREGMRALAREFPAGLKAFKGTFAGTGVNRNFENRRDLERYTSDQSMSGAALATFRSFRLR